MTVCIGAICADQAHEAANALVVASDRMVTMGGFYEFEHEVPKLTPIGNKVVALIAGDAARGAGIVRDVASFAKAGTHSVSTIVQRTCDLYVEHRQRQVEADVLLPRGMTLERLLQGVGLNPQVLFGIDQTMAQYPYGVELLIGGVDDAGAQLYVVVNPGGSFSDVRGIGFTAIGSGAIHAVQSMIGFGHVPFRGLRETVFAVYASKRRAEVAPGVGKDTDLMVVTEDGQYRVEGEALEALEDLYQEYQAPMAEELRNKMSALRLSKEGDGHVPA
jgi:20S proteasome alpha/beta subunit